MIKSQHHTQFGAASKNLSKTISTFFSLSKPKPKLFNLQELEGKTELMKIPKYRQLVSYLRSYNNKCKEPLGEATCATDQKLHQFLYSSLSICCSKTIAQAKQYLEEIDRWHEGYTHKRNLFLQINKKSHKPTDEDQNIRQTYKSNLPSEINHYSRHQFVASPKKFSEKIEAVKKTIGFDAYDDDDKDSVRSFDSDGKENKKEKLLPNLRTYRMEILRMKKAIEDKEDAIMLQEIKKNKTRVHARTVNGFYKPFPSYTGVMTRPSRSPSKENASPPDFYHTSLGFSEIKKKKMNTTMGLYCRFQSSSQTEDKLVESIEGCNLIKNPFETMKKQKHKRKT